VGLGFGEATFYLTRRFQLPIWYGRIFTPPITTTEYSIVPPVHQARVAELEEVAVALDVRVEEAEGQLAAAQAELETVVGERDSKAQQLSEEHAEALASAEASYRAEVRDDL